MRLPILLAILALIAAACSGADTRVEFIYTPLPLTTISGSSTPVAQVGSGVAVADEVLVVVRPEDASEFESWLARTPFSIRQRKHQEVADRVRYTIAVPPGSIVEALEMFESQQSVSAAQLNFVFGVDAP